MNTLLFLLTVGTTLLLHSGDRIPVDGSVREENGVVTFRSGGTLYSMNAADVLRTETVELAPEVKKPVKSTPKRRILSAEERNKLLRELEKNHAGGPATQRPLGELPPPPTTAEVEQKTREEWEWRRDARAHEESIRRAQEELRLLESRIEQLRSEILSFVSLGYKASQFTYQSSELARAQERIPYARLEVERAQRAHEQFREDARRLGILPGWLR